MRQSAILFLALILGSAAFAQTSPTGPHKPAPAPEPVKAAGTRFLVACLGASRDEGH